MVYGVLKLINFAHGDLFTCGAYLGMTLLTSLALQGRLGPLVGLGLLAVMVMGLVALVGVVPERAAYRPVRNSRGSRRWSRLSGPPSSSRTR